MNPKTRRLAVVALFMAGSGCGERAAGGADPHDQQHAVDGAVEVHLDEHQLAAAGIETVEAGPGTIEETLHLAARVVRDPDGETHVNPKVAGIVRAVHVGLGDRVEGGDPLAEIESVELGNKVTDYLKARETAAAAAQTLDRAGELFARRQRMLVEVLDGEIEVASKIFDKEQALQEKGISTVRPFLEAEKALQQARLAKERELTMLEAERDTRLLELDVALRAARIEEAASRDRLRALGFTDEDLAGLAAAEGRYGRMVLSAPRNGLVVARHITVNEHVDTETVLFVLQDLSRVWVLASVYEKDLRRVRTGQPVIVRLDALPGVELPGEVALIDYQIAPDTRAAAVRVELENETIDAWPEAFPLRPGMFGSVDVVVSSRAGRVVIPEAAIVHEGASDFVFTAEGEGRFRRRAVTIRAGARDLVEVVQGVDPGERVVVTGTFTLKSMARSEELGGGHDH